MKRPTIGMVGLPGVGKTTVFKAIVGKSHSPDADRPDVATVGILDVPDERLELILKALSPPRHVHATLEFLDFPPVFGDAHAKRKGGTGFQPVSSHGQDAHATRGSGGELINKLRQLDLLLMVLPGFEQGAEPPATQLRKLQSEMLLADLQVVEGAKERLQKDSRRRGLTPEEKTLFERLENARQLIEKGGDVATPQRESFDWLDSHSFPLLCVRPHVVVVNLAEEQVQQFSLPGLFGSTVSSVSICGRAEMELMDLPAEESKVFRQEMKIGAPAQELVAPECIKALGLITFYTVVGEEVRAWLLKRGGTALEAASQIHTDIAHGFVKAEVVAFEDFATLGSFKQVKNAGKLALEGKDYVIRDGDMLTIRFSK